MIDDLRRPKIILNGKQVAFFDISLTMVAGIVISEWKKLDPMLTTTGLLLLGHVTHKLVGVETQFS